MASRHLSFMGVQLDHTFTTLRLDTGPAAAKLLIEDEVDVALLTPVRPLCTRTVSALAHVLERAGLATVGISLVRGQAEDGRAPRMLHCQFPLGRPLGRPGDPAFQHRVLDAAFALLPRTDTPVLVDFPEVIDDQADQPLACTLPARHDP